MHTSRRFRTALGASCALAALTLSVPASVVAAPYVDDALLQVSTTNPVTGQTLTITLVNFDSGELVDIDLHSVVVRLATVQVDNAGGRVTTVTMPPNAICQHYLTATGRSSGEVARTDIFIGSPDDCGNVGNGNSGNGNVGNANSGDRNVGNGNGGSGNVGNGNTSSGNVGNGNHPYGGAAMTRWGNTSYTSADHPAPQTDPSALAVASIAGLAVVGGAGFLIRRRRVS
jgi:LPXTG-motif cell wall-anchored protein